MKVYVTILGLFLTSCTMADPKPEVEALLFGQADAWNRGDIEGFVDGYWRSEKTVFASGGSVHRGFTVMADRYRANYDTPEKMGKLTFSELTFEQVEADRVVVTGRWELEREEDRPGGVFTLIVRRFKDGWKIVHDHTSSNPKED